MIFKGFALTLGKLLAVLASFVAYMSNFTGCVICIHQPVMPQSIRKMKREPSEMIGEGKIENCG